MNTNKHESGRLRTRAGQGPASRLALETHGGPACGQRERAAKIAPSSAFSRIDLMVTIGMAVLLGGWFGFNHLGERGRAARCGKNLMELGHALQAYANDHEDGIPPAVVDLKPPKVGWDTELFTYLSPKLAKTPGAFEQRQLFNEVSPLFLCPSDTLPRGGHPRSYSMPANDMTAANWPPGPDSATGIGLMWNKQTVKDLLSEEVASSVLNNPGLLPKVKLAGLHAPADTALLTENIVEANTMKSTTAVRVTQINQRAQFANGDFANFHGGQFNYLMADGHVELLSPALTGNAGAADADRPSGIWTMKAGD